MKLQQKTEGFCLPFSNQQQPIFILNHDKSALIFTVQRNNLFRTWTIPIICAFFLEQ